MVISDSVTKKGYDAFFDSPVTFLCSEESYAAEYAASNNISTISKLLGDANKSGSVDAADAAQILRWVVKLVGDADIDLNAANVTGSITVSAADASKILRWIVRLESTLSPN